VQQVKKLIAASEHKISGKLAGSNVSATEQHSEYYKNLLKKVVYSTVQVFSVDETGMFWKKRYARTDIMKEEQKVPVLDAANG
jgi:hypothetical protein